MTRMLVLVVDYFTFTKKTSVLYFPYDAVLPTSPLTVRIWMQRHPQCHVAMFFQCPATFPLRMRCAWPRTCASGLQSQM